MKIRNLVIGLAAGAITAAFSVSASETKSGANTYPKTTVCLAVNHQTDTVTVADCNGTGTHFEIFASEMEAAKVNIFLEEEL